ncbi:hypothetical protein WSTR_01880 [Wolbachia endosymbiont of Laodelphax striatellus]|uniref:hypothetical protein n=1 Tax=Wolbachia endosymbiont of Laodelphax striatellus TaxID=368602 RepID=UPI0007C50E6A|nr:hypothetical protein [Wolbachia endosymbiont of Laodelphax striatellus]OAB82220.1 hypothetical protein WSTR_01880 [Wolbachia endosymbiont of Laodelphax striatellus]
MFDILKDCNGKFNKKNILPIVGTAFIGTITVLSAAEATHAFFTHPSLSDQPHWRDESYGEFLATHIPATIASLSIGGLYTYLSIDNIRKNKQIENLKANSQPNSYIYNTLVNDVLEEQSIV